MKRQVVIIGGVAGGATAAARLRRLDEEAEIIIIERSGYVSFANCGLPYYIGGVIQNRDSLLLHTPESLHARYNLDVRIKSEVISIDRNAKTVEIRNLATDETYTLPYDKLVIATGADPIRPPLKGLEHATNVFTLRSVEDTDILKNYIESNSPKSALIIGGGFIGLEIAENLHHLGIKITIVELLDQILSPLDKEMAAILANHLREKGVEIILNNGVESFDEGGKVIKLTNGKILNPDLTILGIGVKAENKLAKASGIELTEKNGIIVNEKMQSSDPNIYAVGDAVVIKDRVSGSPVQIPLAWPANRQARIAADNICGKNTSYRGTLGTAVIKAFDLTVAVTGHNEKLTQKLGTSYKVIHIHPSSHASYFPGSSNISLKLIYNDSTGEILGAQAIGRNGVDKRIDVINTAIQSGIKAWELQDLELAYAPPFSSAKDPVNMLGYLAEDIRDDLVKTIQWHEATTFDFAKTILIDVRETGEFELGTIAGAVNIPLGELRQSLDRLDPAKLIVVFCQVGLRGYIAARLLSQKGFNVVNLDGGYRTWSVIINNDDHAQSSVHDSGISLLDNTKSFVNNPTPMTSIKIDACGIQCPGPLLKVAKAVSELKEGESIEAVATDPAFPTDIENWCKKTGNIFHKSDLGADGIYSVVISKGHLTKGIHSDATAESLTIILFSGDLDKALAAFIIANGALAFGKKVTIFFTFWGLNVLRKPENVKVNKTLIEKMFGRMMPKGPAKLGISKMQMAGMGPLMIKYIMNQKHVSTLPELMNSALGLGANLIACTMSMDIMGIKREELIDNCSLGGVATYLSRADESNINLFI